MGHAEAGKDRGRRGVRVSTKLALNLSPAHDKKRRRGRNSDDGPIRKEGREGKREKGGGEEESCLKLVLLTENVTSQGAGRGKASRDGYLGRKGGTEGREGDSCVSVATFRPWSRGHK